MTVLDISVAHSLDDTLHTTTHGFNATLDDIRLGNAGVGAGYHASLRFINVAVPPGTELLVAYIVFTPFSAQGGSTMRMNIFCHDADNSGRITSDADWDDTILPNLTAGVTWDFTTTWIQDVEQQTPSILTPIQAIIDRGGWAENNAINVLVNDDGSSTLVDRNARSYDDDPAKAPVLHLEFSSGPGHKRSMATGLT